MPSPVPTTIYCTVVARNYLPQAVVLAQSLLEVIPTASFRLMVVDADSTAVHVPDERIAIVDWTALGISRVEYLNLAAIYNVVELATAIKPRLFRQFLAEFERVVYLDPDMVVYRELTSMHRDLDDHAIVLTPHFLETVPRDLPQISEVHCLTVGYHNLGFCAVRRGAEDFLDWWWSHLERDCIHYPLLGIFVDQKWTDVGGPLFGAKSLHDYGYNIGPWNLHERPFQRTQDGTIVVGPKSDELTLFHFSGFDPNDPAAISTRLNIEMSEQTASDDVLLSLLEGYGARMRKADAEITTDRAYGFIKDTTGRTMPTRLRRIYRLALLKGEQPPSPFTRSDAEAYRAWRRRSGRARFRVFLGDAALAAKYAMPDEFKSVTNRYRSQFIRLRRRLLAGSRIRG